MKTLSVALLIVAISVIALPAVADDGGTMEAGLTDRQFFARVDLSLPGLSKVQEAVSRSDWPQARTAWAHYLRNRDNVKLFEARFVKDRGPRKSKLPRYPTWAESRVANLNERIKDGTFEPHFQARYDGDVYSVRFTDSRQFRLKVKPGDHGRIHVEEKGGAGRNVVAGKSPSHLPTEVFTRIRQTASPEDYVRLRSRERK